MKTNSTAAISHENYSENQNDLYQHLKNEEFNRELLKKNPNAAVVNPDLLDSRQ